MNRILKTKHYTLFIIYIIPMIFDLISPYLIEFNYDTGYLSKYILISNIDISLQTFSSLVFITWVYTIGKVINRYIKDELGINYKLTLFRIIYFIQVILSLTVLIFVLVLNFTSNNTRIKFLSNIDLKFILISSILIYSSLVYNITTSAKVLKTIEFKNKVRFREYVFDLLGFIIFPIGIWNIQNRVNNIINKR